jgi:hypothetical protein
MSFTKVALMQTGILSANVDAESTARASRSPERKELANFRLYIVSSF